MGAVATGEINIVTVFRDKSVIAPDQIPHLGYRAPLASAINQASPIIATHAVLRNAHEKINSAFYNARKGEPFKPHVQVHKETMRSIIGRATESMFTIIGKAKPGQRVDRVATAENVVGRYLIPADELKVRALFKFNSATAGAQITFTRALDLPGDRQPTHIFTGILRPGREGYNIELSRTKSGTAQLILNAEDKKMVDWEIPGIDIEDWRDILKRAMYEVRPQLILG
jgi:hypothetical protein